MFFKSAVDWWFYVVALLPPIVLLRAVIPQLMEANSTVVILSLGAIAPAVIIPIWLLLATYYRVDTAMLRIQAGPFSWSIPLEQIRSVMAIRSHTASPALSSKRLKISYGQYRSILVSPKRRTTFLEAIGRHPEEILYPKSQRQPNPFALGKHLPDA